MKNKKIQRYHMTRCKDKRSIVRALNTFSQQYDYIYCGQEDIKLAIEPMELNFGMEKEDFLFGLKEKGKDVCIDENTIIYARQEAEIDLKDTELILGAIENLISINRQKQIKKVLCSVVQSREMGEKDNAFFKHEEIALKQISLGLNTGDKEKYSDVYIKKLISQIQYRIKFWRSGVYITNNASRKVVAQKVIKPIPTTRYNVIFKQLRYLIRNIETLSFETLDEVTQARSIYEKESKNPHFDIEYTDYENNSTFFHPIDEEEYNDPDAKESTRYNNMSWAMYLQEKDGLYKEEPWRKYHDFDDYEDRVADLTNIIDELIPYLNQKQEILQTIDTMLSPKEMEEFNYYNKDKKLVSVQDIKMLRDDFIKTLYQNNEKKLLSSKVSLIQQYFFYEDVVALLNRDHDTLSMYGFIFSEKEFIDAYRSQARLMLHYQCYTLQAYKMTLKQKGIDPALFKWYDAKEIEKSYWFNLEQYPYYKHLLPPEYFKDENENMTQDDMFESMEEAVRINDFPRPPFPDMKQDNHKEKQTQEESKKIKSYKKRPPIPF